MAQQLLRSLEVSILKRVGPCHTVSSFLNTAAVAMNKMEDGLGKAAVLRDDPATLQSLRTAPLRFSTCAPCFALPGP